MSESDLSEEDLEEQFGEGVPPTVKGEDVPPTLAVVIKDKSLTFDEASKCLNILGKDESGMRYAYLKMSATERKLTDIHIIVNFRHLLFVDVSGNYLNLQALQVLAQLPYLIQLIAKRNFVECALLVEMDFLQDLSLAKNQITISGTLNQPALEYLDLNYNQIYQMHFDPDTLPRLRELELRGNYLYELAGNIPDNVEKLYLAENRIARIIDTDLQRYVNLKVLHLRNNHLKKLTGFSAGLPNLQYLNLRENRINKLRQFRRLAALPKLDTLLILQNPVAGEEKVGGEGNDDDEEVGDEEERVDPTRVALLVLLPNLNRINKTPVTYDERERAKLSYDQKLKEIMDEESSEDEIDPVTTTTDYMTDVNEEDENGEF